MVAGGFPSRIGQSELNQYEGHALQAAGFAALCSEGIDLTRYSIVVDDDVDPSNSDDVIWALSTRTDPATDVDILRRGLTDPLDPMITPEQSPKPPRAL